MLIHKWLPTFSLFLLTALSTVSAAQGVSFMTDVAPILMTRCAGCHGPKKAEGGYRIHTFRFLNAAGDAEEPPVVAGKPDRSPLWQRLIANDADVRMPQDDDPLDPQQLRIVAQWIREGAVFDGADREVSFQALMPPRQHPPAPEQYRVPVPVLALAFSPDGKYVATGGYNEIVLWDVANGKPHRRIGNLPQRIQGIVWKGQNKLLVGGGTPGEYGEISIVDATTGKREKVFGTFDDIVLAVASNPAGDLVAAGSAGMQSRVYQHGSGQMLWQARVHSDWVTGVAFSPDNQFLVTTSRDQTAKVHEVQSGTLYTTYNGHRKQLGKFTGRFAIYDITFDARSGAACTVGEGRAVRIWNPVMAQKENGDASDMEGRFFKAGHTRFIEHGLKRATLTLTATNGQLFAAGADGELRQFDIATAKPVRTYRGHSDWVYAVAGSPEANLVATGSFDGEVRLWDTSTGTLLRTFLAAPGLAP
jgi:WD40 repeat protein